MSSIKNCNACNKSVYPTEKLTISNGTHFHKGCFKCSDKTCGITLSLKSFQFQQNLLWCAKHTPKHEASHDADTIAINHALHAPKKVQEGLSKQVVNQAESHFNAAESMGVQHAMNAPKKLAENLGYIHKGI